jgi:glycosyltransferase involved in cell wall biosynthesis
MITIIIPVRNRSNSRLQRCIRSFIRHKIIKECIIVDYGSDVPIKYSHKKVRVINYPKEKNFFFNKAHAINLGIKSSKTDYIGTIDADIILSPKFLDRVREYLSPKVFIYSKKVRRLKWKDYGTDFKKCLKKATSWTTSRGKIYESDLQHFGTGGIQIYSKKWIYKIGGIDENLVGLGGMDNYTVFKAEKSGLDLISLNEYVLHQEHQKKKEDQFDESIRRFMAFVRAKKRFYLEEIIIKNKKCNEGFWGVKKGPNQPFLKECKKEFNSPNLKKNENINRANEMMKHLVRKYLDNKLSKRKMEKELKEFSEKNKLKMTIKWPRKKK